MQTITLEQAKKDFAKVVRDLPSVGEFVIIDSDRPVAKLSTFRPQTSLRNLKPVSLGGLLSPFPTPEDDLLDEMLNQPE